MSAPSGPDPPPDLAGLLAHEARTPLNAIAGLAELLLSGGCGPLSLGVQACLGDIARAARRLACGLDAVIALHQLAETAPATSAGPLDLRALLAEAGLAPPAGSAGNVLVMGEPEAWHLVIRTLVGLLCRSGVRPLVQLETQGAALALTLTAPPEADGLGRAEIELARRLARRQGAELTLAEAGRVVLRWPRPCWLDPGTEA